MASVTHNSVQGEPVSSMTWDADGNRVSFTSSTGTATQFVYDVTAGIPAVIEETGPVYYVREPNGALIVRLDGEFTNYYHFDALGSTRLLTDSYGTVTDAYAYDAWGGTSDQSGPTVQPYQFVGQLGYYFPIQDENFPLLHLGVRFYDPAETGRFTQRDRIGEEQGTYEYALSSPTRYTDPHGLTPEEEFAKKARECGRKCLIECALRPPLDPKDTPDKCFAKCLAKCMGKAFTESVCVSAFCYFPVDSVYCQPKNSCEMDQSDSIYCGHCCDIKYFCCVVANILKPGGTEGCRHKQTYCYIGCQSCN